MLEPGKASLAEVLITAELARRPARQPDRDGELATLLALADELAEPSRHAEQRVVDVAMAACNAGSAGFSLREVVDGKERYRWSPVAGALRDLLRTAVPREGSLAALAVDSGAPQLFRYPERHFRHLAERRPQIVEVLEVPLRVGDAVPYGVLWVISHDRERQFDAEDLRRLENLAHFANASHQAYALLELDRTAYQKKNDSLVALSSELRDAMAVISNASEYLVIDRALDRDERARAHAIVQRQLAQIGLLSEQLLDAPGVGERLSWRTPVAVAAVARPRTDLKRQRVLIIDDSVDSADSLAMLLRLWGHDVRTAQGAVAGLQLEWEFEPHAVILDIEMPGKNGYEVASELRVRRRRALLLVALSGFAREEDRARSLAAGFDHHLTKPADVGLLERVLS